MNNSNAGIVKNAVYRLFCVSTGSYNATVIGGASVEGTKLNMQAYTSFAKSQFIKIAEIQEDTSRGLLWINMLFQCNGETASADTLYPSVSGAGATSGEDLQIRTSDTSTPAKSRRISWYIEPDGRNATINGSTYETFKLVAATPWNISGVKLVMDCSGSYASVRSDNGSNGQRFVLIRDTFLNSTMAQTGFVIPEDTGIPKNSSIDMVVAFTGSSSDNYQMRYRKRGLFHNTESFGPWGDWLSPLKLKSDEGFGDGSKPNAGREDAIMTVEAANESKGIDSCEYQVFGRQTTSSEPYYHGQDNSTTFVTKQEINPQIVSITMTNSGLRVLWNTNSYRTNGAIRITMDDLQQGSTKLASGRTETFTQLNEGTFTIPLTELEYYPEEGSLINVVMHFEYLNRYVTGIDVISKELDVGYEGGELHPEINSKRVNDYDIEVVITERDGKPFNAQSLTLMYEHKGKVRNHELTLVEGKYYVAEPLNVEYTLLAQIENTSQFSTWGTSTVTQRGPKTCAVVINTANTEVVITKFASDFKDVVKVSDNPDNKQVSLGGNDLPDAFIGTAIPGEITASNLLYDRSYKIEIERAINDRKALFRDFDGRYIFCIIGQSDDKRWDNPEWDVRNLSFTETNNRFDIAIPVVPD